MARINDRLLIQRVGDRLVIVDEHNGNETPLELADGPRLVAMAAYLTNTGNPEAVLADARTQLEAVGAVPSLIETLETLRPAEETAK